MTYAPIAKSPAEWRVEPNLLDLEVERTPDFWVRARGLLDGLPAGGLNIAHEAVDRHAIGERSGRLAFRFLGKDDTIRDVSYADLAALTNPHEAGHFPQQ